MLQGVVACGASGLAQTLLVPSDVVFRPIAPAEIMRSTPVVTPKPEWWRPSRGLNSLGYPLSNPSLYRSCFESVASSPRFYSAPSSPRFYSAPSSPIRSPNLTRNLNCDSADAPQDAVYPTRRISEADLVTFTTESPLATGQSISVSANTINKVLSWLWSTKRVDSTDDGTSSEASSTPSPTPPVTPIATPTTPPTIARPPKMYWKRDLVSMTDVRPHSGWTLDKPTNPSNIRLLRIQMLDAQLAPVPFNTVQCLKPEWAWRPAEWECEFGRVLGCLTTLPTSGPAQLKQAKWLTQTLTSLRGAPHVIGLLGTYESIKDEDQPSRYHRLLLQYPGNSLEMLVHGFRYTLGRPQPPAHHTSRVPTDLSIQGLDVPSPQLRGGLPLKEVFELAIGLASALKTLHANRLTVGPLRPSGISLSPWGTWMLTDVFRLRHLGSPSDPDLPFHRLPQRRFFGCSDREDDIWSLGLCVLYALFGDEPWPYIVQSVTKLEHVPDTSRCLKEYESLRTNKAARKRFSTRLYAGLMRHPRLRRHFGNNKQLSAVVYFASCCLELHPAKLLTAKRAHATLLSTFAIRFN